MKVMSLNDKITVYMYKNEDIDDINDYIKKLILKLKRKYKINIFGFYQINLYKNKKVGMIIDIIKDDIDYFYDLLDLKITVYDDSDIYICFDDYFLETVYDVLLLDDKYYIDVNNLSHSELLWMTEFSSFVYGDELDSIKNRASCLTK